MKLMSSDLWTWGQQSAWKLWSTYDCSATESLNVTSRFNLYPRIECGPRFMKHIAKQEIFLSLNEILWFRKLITYPGEFYGIEPSVRGLHKLYRRRSKQNELWPSYFMWICCISSYRKFKSWLKRLAVIFALDIWQCQEIMGCLHKLLYSYPMLHIYYLMLLSSK